MRTARFAIIVLAFLIGSGGTLGTSSALGQDLGGFGAASRYASPGMGGGGPMIVPYGGMFEGFLPGRMGGGSSLSLRSRSAGSMGAGRTPFSLSPMSGGTSAMPGARAIRPLGSGGAMGLGGIRRMPGAGATSVMPPSFASPFRQPPSLVAPPAGMGMSM